MENGRNDVREDVQDGDKDRHGEASPVELQEIGKLITVWFDSADKGVLLTIKIIGCV